ncbi:MAG: hypothetical protein WC543_01640 [Candidatus Omnitrophota bacterium]
MSKNKIISWQVALGAVLILLCAAVYYLHFLIFRDAHHIFLYLIGDIAFVFLEVFLVTLVVHNLLAAREKQTLLKKMNMVIGAFFSEVGRELIKFTLAFDVAGCPFAQKLLVRAEWTDAQFSQLQKQITNFACDVDSHKGNLDTLKNFLVKKRTFLMTLLENQNILEHESFTDLLWAVFHLTEELQGRDNLQNLSSADYEHLSVDIKRVYRQTVAQWLLYMKHFKADYPYLFSLAMRTNPFDPEAKVEVK